MTTDTLPVTEKTTHAETILKRSVCLVLRAEYFGNYRKVELSTIDLKKNGDDLDKQKKDLTMMQKLVPTTALKQVNKAIDSAKAYVASISVAGHRVFGSGAHLIPIVKVSEVIERLKQYQADIREQAAKVKEQWPEIMEKAQAERGPLFNAAHYPTAEEVEQEFQLDYNFVSFGAPEQLLEVDKAAYEVATIKCQEKLAQAHTEWLVGMREAALKVMRELRLRLQPGTDGKAKALHPAALRDLNELIQNLPVMNLTDDDTLVDVISPVGAVAEGLDVETLRKAPAVRAMLLAKAEEACAHLDGLVSSGRRAMNLG